MSWGVAPALPHLSVGLRLGATLATLAAEQRGDVESMVLWDR